MEKKLASALGCALEHIHPLHPDAVSARKALAEFDSRTFARACHDLADRAQEIERRNPGLTQNEKHFIRMLRAACHRVGDDADVRPDLYQEN